MCLEWEFWFDLLMIYWFVFLVSMVFSGVFSHTKFKYIYINLLLQNPFPDILNYNFQLIILPVDVFTVPYAFIVFLMLNCFFHIVRFIMSGPDPERSLVNDCIKLLNKQASSYFTSGKVEQPLPTLLPPILTWVIFTINEELYTIILQHKPIRL